MIKALTVKNLRKVYGNSVEALKGVSLEIEEGDFFAFLGPNGAGKTTLIGIVSGLVVKTSGEVKIFDKSIDSEPEAAKVFIGVVPQEVNFNFFEKVIDIVVNQAGYYGVSRKIALERAEKYLKQLDLWKKKDEPARMLSGGMKRRLMIARALIHEPKLLVLDEPTAGVDIELRHGMWKFLTELSEGGVTILLTTHYLEEAEQLCKNLAIINNGEIVEQGPMKTLLSELDKETFIFNLRVPATQKSLGSFREPYSVLFHDSHTLEMTMPRGASLNEFFKELDGKKVEIASMRNKSNRLEELFLSLTRKDETND
ncbi:MAG: ABC transporter ATP-binding protein [Candidatus Liptonbacteria bacterium]|nr:ABC transporter ATP-binding protein [Candidatus Liptonbacteria bacterium]